LSSFQIKMQLFFQNGRSLLAINQNILFCLFILTWSFQVTEQYNSLCDVQQALVLLIIQNSLQLWLLV
jgi:hypothetical protein